MKNTKKIIIILILIILAVSIIVSSITAAKGNQGLFESVWNSFKLTFIDNDGWAVLLYGLLATIILTIVTIILGAILGIAVFFLIYSGNNTAAVIFMWARKFLVLIPFTTFLFICFYIFFARSTDKPMIASCFALTMWWGSTVCAAFCFNVEKISEGQYEAAKAMGYTRMKAFKHVILPQALPGILDLLEDETVGIIKSTSVVGMIYAMDLQKAIDILTLKTNEPVMPIIVASILYILLGLLGVKMVRIIAKHTIPRNRSAEKILADAKKGVLG